MLVYYSVVMLTVILGISAQFVNSRTTPIEIIDRNGTIRYKNTYSIFYPLLIFLFVFVGGFRYYVGSDFGGYYIHSDYQWTEVIDHFRTLDEPGLRLLAFLSRRVWDDGVAVIFAACLVITLLVFRGISKFDNNDITIMLLVYVFIAGWTFSFNGVRQALAASIIFAFARVNDKNWILKYVILCFVAFLFHSSALMMIPILILSRRNINRNQILILLFSAAIIPLFFDFAFEFMGADTTNQDALTYIEREINPIRVAVAFAPIVLLFFVENKGEFFERNSFVVNMMLYNAALTFTTMNSAYLNRFTQYTVMFLMVYYPSVLKTMKKEYRVLATVFIIVLYFFFWRYELMNGVDEVIWQWSFNHFGEH